MNWPFEISERDHTIQDPISEAKLHRLGEYLELDSTSQVLDLGCGKAEPDVILARDFGCHVSGVELRPAFVEAAQKRIAETGLEAQITVEAADGKTFRAEDRHFDAALCLGASFIWGHLGDAAKALQPAVKDGGFVVVGEPFWQEWPLPAAVQAQAFVDLPSTVQRFEDAGIHFVGLIPADLADWDHYESLHWRAIEAWLSENPDHADAATIRKLDWQFRQEYLAHQRQLLGWGMFVGRVRRGAGDDSETQ